LIHLIDVRRKRDTRTNPGVELEIELDDAFGGGAFAAA